VQLSADTSDRIAVRVGDDIRVVAREFVALHALDATYAPVLAKMLQAQIQKTQLAKARKRKAAQAERDAAATATAAKTAAAAAAAHALNSNEADAAATAAVADKEKLASILMRAKQGRSGFFRTQGLSQ
jgi:hypothetical protein